MKLFLIRHGECTANVIGCYIGWGDFHLTEKGREQAERIKENINRIHFDDIYSSDLTRASETAGILFGDKYKIKYSDLLRENNCGILSGYTVQQVSEKYGDKFSEMNPYDYTDFEGETIKDLQNRVIKFLRKFEIKDLDKNIAAVTHGGPIKSILAYVLKSDFEHLSDIISINNCGVSVIEWNDWGWTLLHHNIILDPLQNDLKADFISR